MTITFHPGTTRQQVVETLETLTKYYRDGGAYEVAKDEVSPAADLHKGEDAAGDFPRCRKCGAGGALTHPPDRPLGGLCLRCFQVAQRQAATPHSATDDTRQAVDLLLLAGKVTPWASSFGWRTRTTASRDYERSECCQAEITFSRADGVSAGSCSKCGLWVRRLKDGVLQINSFAEEYITTKHLQAHGELKINKEAFLRP